MDTRLLARLNGRLGITEASNVLTPLPEVEKVTFSKVLSGMAVWVHPAEGYSDEQVAEACNQIAGIFINPEKNVSGEIEATVSVDFYGSITDPRNSLEFHRWFHHRDRKWNETPWLNWHKDMFKTGVEFTEETERRGSKIIIAMLDSGVETGIAEFDDGRVTEIYDAWSDGPGYHGPATTSMIAGKNIGIVPEAQILDVRVLQSFGAGGSVSSITAGMEALVDWINDPLNNVADDDLVIANMSIIAYGNRTSDMREAIQAAYDAGILVFACSGNNGSSIIPDSSLSNAFPAQNTYRGAVCNIDITGKMHPSSNYSKEFYLFTLGTRTKCADGRTPTSTGYFHPIGTSLSSPLAAGCAATFFSGRYRPKNELDVRDMMDEFIFQACEPVEIQYPSGTILGDLPNQSYFPLAYNTPIEHLQRHQTLDVIIDYSFPEDEQVHDDLVIHIMYD